MQQSVSSASSPRANEGAGATAHCSAPIAWVHLAAAVLALLALTLGSPTSAAPRQVQTLDPWTTGDGAAGDGFGNALARQDDWLAIGASGKVVPVPGILNGFAEGVVYLYQWDGMAWQPTQTLFLPEHSSSANFGGAVAFRGNRLLVGAPRFTVGGAVEAGQAYVYQRSGPDQWALIATLDSPLPEADGRFAAALSWLSDDELVIGAPRETDRGQGGAGRVHRYAFDGSDWQLVGTLLPVAAEADAGFGSALLPWQGGLLVGVPNAGADDAGAVDQFGDLASPVLQRLAGVFGASASFGAAIAGDDQRLAIAAPSGDVGAVAAAGRVALYLAGPAAIPDQLLSAPAPGELARYGQALVLRDDRLWIGAPQADVAGDPDEGEVHVYPLDGSGAGSPLTLSDPAVGLSGRLGIALAIEADGSLLAGADLDRVGPNGQGSVKRFAVAGSGYASATRIDRGDGAYLERFGSAVALRGEWAVAASFLERTEVGAEAGAAYVYRLVDGQWERFQRLLSPDPATEQRFGVAVALSDTHLAVGAYWDATTGVIDAGAAYVYRFDGAQWILQSSLRAPEPELEEFFGFSVALHGDRLLVGAPGSNRSDFDEGAAYLYRLQADQWQLESTLEVPGSEFVAFYGTRVALGPDLALLSAPGASSSGVSGAGAVAAFRLNGDWAFERRITAPMPMAGAGFGAAVALEGDTIAVAASTDPAAGASAGAVYIEHDGAPMLQLTAADALPGDRLGSALALTGDVLLAGAPGVDIADQSSQGALYRWLYRNGQWQPDPRLLIDEGSGLDGFGLSLAADGEWAFAGAPFKAVTHPQEGRVYAVAVGELFADGFED